MAVAVVSWIRPCAVWVFRRIYAFVVLRAVWVRHFWERWRYGWNFKDN